MVRILGIDPGLNITGYAVLDLARGGGAPQIVEAGTIRTNPRADLSERVEQLFDGLCEILREHRPAKAAIEQLFAHASYPRTAVLMAHARGVAILACRQAGLELSNLPATMVKKSLTGNGHASKTQIQRAIQATCGLDELPRPADVADAVAIALCAGRRFLEEAKEGLSKARSLQGIAGRRIEGAA